MLARHHLRPVFTPSQEELWIYRDQYGTRKASVGSAIRYSIIPAPLHYIQLFLRGRFWWMLDLRDITRMFHVWSLLIMAVGIDPFGEDQPMEGLTLDDSVKHWTPAIRAFFIGLARNGFSAHAEEIPLSGFLAFLRFYTILRRDAWAFSYLPEDGGTSVIEPLADKIRELGGEIRLGGKVNRIEAGPIWKAHCEEETFSAKQIILATDASAASSLLKNSFGENDLYFPRSLANAIVRLWFDAGPKPGPESGMFTGDFVMQNFFWLDRIYARYRKWSKATGGSAIEVHIYGPQEILQKVDAALLAQVITEFHRVYPELRGHLIFQHIQRNAATHTLPSLGSRDRHLGIVTGWPNLFCAGDWVRDPMPSFFLERACVTGIKAANAVLKSRGLSEWPLVAYLPPEPFAGWIEKLMVRGRKQRIAKRKLQRAAHR
jgi:isorenieratene synthase